MAPNSFKDLLPFALTREKKTILTVWSILSLSMIFLFTGCQRNGIQVLYAETDLPVMPTPFAVDDSVFIQNGQDFLLFVEPQIESDTDNPERYGTYSGQYSFAMIWSFLHPDHPMTGAAVSATAAEKGWHDTSIPYTSPSNMVKMAQYYAYHQYTGIRVDHGFGSNETAAKGLLHNLIVMGDPVIIDVTVDVAVDGNHNYRNTHYIVVTGIASDGTVYYNDPLSGSKSTSWKNIWDSWKNNTDPGGQVWYLVIY